MTNLRYVGALSAVLIGARVLSAQTGAEVAAMGCKNAAARELKSQRANGEPSFQGSPSVVQRKRGETQMRGEGQYLDVARKPRRFVYECAYRPHSAKTTVTLSFPDSVNVPKH
jgi:hypothetical protein